MSCSFLGKSSRYLSTLAGFKAISDKEKVEPSQMIIKACTYSVRNNTQPSEVLFCGILNPFGCLSEYVFKQYHHLLVVMNQFSEDVKYDMSEHP